MTTREITPIKISVWDDAQANKLGASITQDDLENFANIDCVLLDEMSELARKTVTIEGDDYENWSGDTDELFTLLAAKLNVTLI